MVGMKKNNSLGAPTGHDAAALLRWEAYAGWALNEKPAAVVHQANIDRNDFGSEFVLLGNDNIVKWSAIRTLRFLVNICGLTYTEAKGAVDHYAKNKLLLDAVPATPEPDTAKEIIKGCRDIIEAVDTAAHTISVLDPRDTMVVQYWKNVLDIIQSHQDLPLDTGIENW